MANWSDPRMAAGAAPRGAGIWASFDAGLRSYMLSVYNYMLSGVLVSGIVALLFSWGGADSPAAHVMGTPLAWVIMLAPLGFVMALSFGLQRMQTSTVSMVFWAFAVAMGLSLSTIFLVYTNASIAQTFFASAAAFGGLSLYGYTTKKDLSGMGTFLIMGVIGLLVAMVINMFVHSGPLALVISLLGVLIFAGLTAYDTQRIKSMYFQVAGTEMAGKSAIMGALSLYLDFINMFMFLLQMFGQRR